MASEPFGYIYVIRNCKTGKQYIGQTTNIEKRQKSHFTNLAGGYRVNRYLQNAYNLDGPESFDFRVLDEASCREELNHKESELIELNMCMFDEHGYNLKSGGDAGVPSNEVRLRLSEALKGKPHKRRSDPLVVSENISRSKTGENHPMFGKSFTDDRRKAISAGLSKFNNDNPGFFAGEKNGMFGNTHTEETKNKIRNKAQGRKQTPESIKKMVEKISIPVLCRNTGIVYSSATEAARELGLHPATINKALSSGTAKAGKDSEGNPLRWERLT